MPYRMVYIICALQEPISQYRSGRAWKGFTSWKRQYSCESLWPSTWTIYLCWHQGPPKANCSKHGWDLKNFWKQGEMILAGGTDLPSAALYFCWMLRILSLSFSSLSTAFSALSSSCFMFSPTACTTQQVYCVCDARYVRVCIRMSQYAPNLRFFNVFKLI